MQDVPKNNNRRDTKKSCSETSTEIGCEKFGYNIVPASIFFYLQFCPAFIGGFYEVRVQPGQPVLVH